MAELLVARGVTKRFGGLTAVNGMSLAVPAEAIHSVIGPNGAGKTTFFNCLTGFYRPEEGEIRFGGDHDLVGRRTDEITRLGITRTYQNIRLFPNLSAIENVLIGQHSHLNSSLAGMVFHLRGERHEEAEALEEARRLLAFVGLAGKGDTLARNLPYGDQRRLEVARALATRPKLLLLDEPTAGMNPNETAAMIDFIRHLRDSLGITVLLIEHDMKVVMTISEHISVMDFGEKIAEGSPAEIQANPRVIEAYLGRGAAAEVESAGQGPGIENARGDSPGAPGAGLPEDGPAPGAAGA